MECGWGTVAAEPAAGTNARIASAPAIAGGRASYCLAVQHIARAIGYAEEKFLHIPEFVRILRYRIYHSQINYIWRTDHITRHPSAEYRTARQEPDFPAAMIGAS